MDGWHDGWTDERQDGRREGRTRSDRLTVGQSGQRCLLAQKLETKPSAESQSSHVAGEHAAKSQLSASLINHNVSCPA